MRNPHSRSAHFRMARRSRGSCRRWRALSALRARAARGRRHDRRRRGAADLCRLPRRHSGDPAAITAPDRRWRAVMKIAIAAGAVADALALAASIVDEKTRIAVWGAVRIVADAGVVNISATTLARALSTTAIATVFEAGEVATSAAALASLITELPSDATVTLAGDDRGVTITCGRSRWRLPAVPIADLPPAPVFKAEPVAVTLAGEDLLRALDFCSFAISREQARQCLTGIFLHVAGDGAAALRAVS